MPAADDPEVLRRAGAVRILLMDVDGVLTDGSLCYLPDGTEAKVFNVRDGAGIKLAQRAGILTGIITGRDSVAMLRRAEELEMDEIHQRVGDKQAVYAEILARRSLTDGQVCFIGDDVVDMPLMRRAGLSAAPADAHPSVIALARLVTAAVGGRGAVREVIDCLLRAQGKWDEVTAPYSGS